MSNPRHLLICEIERFLNGEQNYLWVLAIRFMLKEPLKEDEYEWDYYKWVEYWNTEDQPSVEWLDSTSTTTADPAAYCGTTTVAPSQWTDSSSLYIPKYSIKVSGGGPSVFYDYSGVGVIHPDEVKGLNLFAFVFNNKKKPVTEFLRILDDDYDLLPLGIFTPFSKFLDIKFRKASELPLAETKKWEKPLSKVLSTASARAL